MDLSLEDNYIFIKEEVEKAIDIRKFITTSSELYLLYSEEQSNAHLPERSIPINSMVRFVTYEDIFNHISIYTHPLNSLLSIHKESLVLRESEIETYSTLCDVFKAARACMKTLQCHPISHYLMCMWGLMFQLKNLLKKESFGERTGQELFTNCLIRSIEERVGTSVQLNDKQRDLLVRAMLMDPFTKNTLKSVFPSICKQTRIAAQKKELVSELTGLIRKLRELKSSEEEEETEPAKKKKKKSDDMVDIFAFLEPVREQTDVNAPITKDPELKWFVDEYLSKDQTCSSN